jgi:hypothetical protein
MKFQFAVFLYVILMFSHFYFTTISNLHNAEASDFSRECIPVHHVLQQHRVGRLELPHQLRTFVLTWEQPFSSQQPEKS